MRIPVKPFVWLALTALLVISAMGQEQPPSTTPRTQNAMPGMDMGDVRGDAEQTREAAKSVNDSMADHDMHMGAHMFMTDLRPPNSADAQRAAQIVEALRKSIPRYRDYKMALADGFRIFMPNLPQPLYHFTNYGYGYEAEFHFNPEEPTSLLYKKTSDGYELVGAMYTAPRNSTDDQLNARVPLSVARWHKHVNLCLPQKGTPIEDVDWQKFGSEGSIATEEVCEQSGGRWFPQVFNWMVHVYPYATDPNKVWAR